MNNMGNTWKELHETAKDKRACQEMVESQFSIGKKKQYEKNVRLLNMIISMCLGEGVEMRIWGVAPTQGDQVCFTAWTL